MSTIEGVYLDGNGDFLVGLVSDQIVAMGALKKTGDRRGELKRMRVSPEFQRRGYGKAILEALERRAFAFRLQNFASGYICQTGGGSRSLQREMAFERSAGKRPPPLKRFSTKSS